MVVTDENRQRLMARFEKLVERGDDENACWYWSRGPHCVGGYGMLSVNGCRVLAHRLAFELFVGPIPDGMLVCHVCDRHVCVRPDHLFVGDHKANMADMKAKGRARFLVGDAHPKAKLSNDQARQIREMYATGHYGQHDMAAHFGVSRRIVCFVLAGQHFRDAGGPLTARGKGKPPPMKPTRAGERAPPAKLTNDQAREIRERYARGDIAMRALAAQFGVGSCAIHHICRGRTYAEAGGPLTFRGSGHYTRKPRTRAPAVAP